MELKCLNLKAVDTHRTQCYKENSGV